MCCVTWIKNAHCLTSKDWTWARCRVNRPNLSSNTFHSVLICIASAPIDPVTESLIRHSGNAIIFFQFVLHIYSTLPLLFRKVSRMWKGAPATAFLKCSSTLMLNNFRPSCTPTVATATKKTLVERLRLSKSNVIFWELPTRASKANYRSDTSYEISHATNGGKFAYVCFEASRAIDRVCQEIPWSN